MLSFTLLDLLRKGTDADIKARATLDSATREAWQSVQDGWDSAYLFSYNPDSSEFSAARRDDPSVVLTDKDPELLRDKVYLNYVAHPVSREVAP